MASGKAWNRRLALAGGAALAAAGGYFALPRSSGVHHKITEAGTFLRGNVAEPETLDPTQSSGTQENEIIGDLMIGLMTHDPACKAIPGMATRWETSADGLTWTFTLREALWSDGTPVTAEDFVFSWRRLVDPASASSYAYFLHLVKNGAAISAGRMPPTAMGITAIDARTLRVELEHPAPYLLELLTPHHHLSPAAPCRDGQGQGVGPAGQLCRQRRLHSQRMDSQRSRAGGEESPLL